MSGEGCLSEGAWPEGGQQWMAAGTGVSGCCPRTDGPHLRRVWVLPPGQGPWDARGYLIASSMLLTMTINPTSLFVVGYVCALSQPVSFRAAHLERCCLRRFRWAPRDAGRRPMSCSGRGFFPSIILKHRSSLDRSPRCRGAGRGWHGLCYACGCPGKQGRTPHPPHS